MPVLPTASVEKRIEFGAPYTPDRFNAQIDKLHGRAALISGFQVTPAPGDPLKVRVFPGRALLRGIVVEVTDAFDIALPGLTPPFVLYLDTADEDPTTNTVIDFALPTAVPTGAVILREWTGTSLVIGGRFETLAGRTRGVAARRLLRAITEPNQSIFPLTGLHFRPTIDELLIWADHTKQQIGAGADVTLQGLRSLTFVTPLAAGAFVEILAFSSVRFRETRIGITDPSVGLAAGNLYTPIVSDLLVFKNGGLLSPVIDYIENDATAFALVTAPVASDEFEIYGIEGLLFRETFNLVAGTAITMGFHAYDPGRHALLVFAAGSKLMGGGIDYTEVSAEQITLKTPFTGRIEVVILHSLIGRDDVLRELGEIVDLGRNLADAIKDPEDNRPSEQPPTKDNPFATVLDVTTNQEIVEARGDFLNLNGRITAAVSASGEIVLHGDRHKETGADPIPVATSTVGGLFSAEDKTRLDTHIGAGGAAHAIALGDPTPDAGFMSGADKAKLDRIKEILLPKGVWAVRFYNFLSGPGDPEATLTGQVKSGIAFLYPTIDGSVFAISPAANDPQSFHTRFTMTIDVASPASNFWSMMHTFMNGVNLFVNGIFRPLGQVGSRAEGAITIDSGLNQRIDVVFIGLSVGTLPGVRCSFNTNLLAPGKPVTFVSAP